MSTSRLLVTPVKFDITINTDNGSGARLNLHTWKPVLPAGQYYLGPMATNNNTSGYGVVVKDLTGDCLVDIDGWEQVWNDGGSGKSTDFALWRAKCNNPNFIALASFFTRSHDPPTAVEAAGIKAVRRELILQGTADPQIWTDARSGAHQNGSVWGVSSQGKLGMIVTGAFVAAPGYTVRPPAYVLACAKVVT